jgi:DNA invertase Pin-like site-specific DNA recombinase
VTRAAIYARFSSDLSDRRSIEDQAALCREHAARQGWATVEVYADYAVSGASLHGRFAFERMIADAKRQHFVFQRSPVSQEDWKSATNCSD